MPTVAASALGPQEMYEIWLQLLRGETAIRAAADDYGMDRSTIMKLRAVAKQSALDALARSHGCAYRRFPTRSWPPPRLGLRAESAA